MPSIHEQLHLLRERLETIDIEKARLAREVEELTAQLEKSVSSAEIRASSQFTPDEKIAIFMNLFRGREDVFPKR